MKSGKFSWRFSRNTDTREDRATRSSRPDDPTLLFTGAGMNQFKDIPRTRRPVAQARPSLSEMPAHRRHRQRRPDRRPPDVLRDARELLLRRLLQTRSDHLGVGAGDRDVRESTLRACASRSTRTTTRHTTSGRTTWESAGTGFTASTRRTTSGRRTPRPRARTAPADRAARFLRPRPEFGCGKPIAPGLRLQTLCRVLEPGVYAVRPQARRKLEPLPQKNIDTGMGFERMVAVLQDKPDNFETDLFCRSSDASRRSPGGSTETKSDVGRRMRRIADHARALTFCIADGVLPSNEGRGYVLRRSLRGPRPIRAAVRSASTDVPGATWSRSSRE